MENNKTNVELKNEENEHISTSNALSDEQRVKVMSPSQLVFKRFIRNKLAVIGFVILELYERDDDSVNIRDKAYPVVRINRAPGLKNLHRVAESPV